MKRYEALARSLAAFESGEEHTQEIVADYIECPSIEDCNFNGVDTSVCTKCKIKWLLGEWE